MQYRLCNSNAETPRLHEDIAEEMQIEVNYELMCGNCARFVHMRTFIISAGEKPEKLENIAVASHTFWAWAAAAAAAIL
jgi:hypothetical protein